jgi:septum formation protein
MATQERLILASASPARRELLARAGYRFEVMPSEVEEPAGQGVTDPRAFVQQIAWSKAAAVAQRVPRGLVIAADSVGWHQGRVIGKPIDLADARRILSQLAGTRHQLWTGVCLWHRPGDCQVAWQEASVVEMKALSSTEIEDYLATGIWQGKSGAYAIQDEGDPFIRVVQGSVSNVIGLPLESLAQVLAWLEDSCPGIPFSPDL